MSQKRLGAYHGGKENLKKNAPAKSYAQKKPERHEKGPGIRSSTFYSSGGARGGGRATKRKKRD